mmetsp:Transcript_28964/g.61202  ORF Transcript_28964/g.61202 Transcript_28964/m.61202 type:complete len:352 (+) Transcript_28964:1222-2277(+)
MCRHGSLGRETAEDAHGINEVTKEGNSDELVNSFGKIVEGQRQIAKDIRVGKHEGQGTSSGGKETRILTQVQKCHSSGRSSQSTKTLTQSIPLSNGLRAILSALFHQKLFESLARSNGETPISRRSPISQSLISFDWHGFLKNIKDHTKGVQRRSVESLEDGWSHLKTVFASLVHAAEGVSRAADLDVTFETENLGTVFGTEGRAGESSHTRSNDDNVVFASVARETISGSWVGGLFVFGFDGHIIGEGHDLLTGGVLDLSHIVVHSFFGFFFFDGGVKSREGCASRRWDEGVGGEGCGQDGEGRGGETVSASDHFLLDILYYVALSYSECTGWMQRGVNSARGCKLFRII